MIHILITNTKTGETHILAESNSKFFAKALKVPDYLKKCPLVSDWCMYNGEVYYAELNYEKSIEKKRPVFDLAHCATQALNGIFLKTRVWNKNKFSRWEGKSNW